MIRVSNWLCGCGQADTCATQAFMTIDLGAAHSLTGVTVWHYYGNERAYCSQKVAISMTGAFSGEETVVYDTGSCSGWCSFPITCTNAEAADCTPNNYVSSVMIAGDRSGLHSCKSSSNNRVGRGRRNPRRAVPSAGRRPSGGTCGTGAAAARTLACTSWRSMSTAARASRPARHSALLPLPLRRRPSGLPRHRRRPCRHRHRRRPWTCMVGATRRRRRAAPPTL